jgi:GT2 family glycosyltransferase
VNYNAQYFLKNCIGSINRSLGVNGIEIIVVDNASTDESCEMLRADFPEVRLIENPVNVGFSKANNQGVAMAGGTHILILNPDTLIAEDTLRNVLQISELKKDMGVLGVRFIDGSGRFLPESKRNFPDLMAAGLKLMGISRKYYARHIAEKETAAVDILSGAFMFMKKSVFDQIGGFDEDFFMYGEDIDLSYRISQAGYTNYYFGGVTLLHYKGESTLKNAAHYQNFYGAMKLFYQKHLDREPVSERLIGLIVNTAIRIKSLEKTKQAGTTKSFRKWIYFGNNQGIFDKIQNAYPGTTGEMMHSLPDFPISTDFLFYDSACFTFKEIIKFMSAHKDMLPRQRIISEDGTFFAGSDLSHTRGQVVVF